MSEATFEEYKKATKYARWKYKYGLFVLIACWICLVLLIIYIILYAKELSIQPIVYGVNKMNINECYCYGDSLDYYINKTSIIVKEKLTDLPLF